MTRRLRPELDRHRLRRIAELTVAALPAWRHPLSDADSNDLKQWHELQVSQIELDVQNSALVELQQECDLAESGREHYAALYDQAPSGYLSVDESGCIMRANHAASELLACPRDRLPGKRF